jgi:4-hydroxythreonine-4-phosphate dehydrogenase
MKPKILITCGDPNGIGPELILKIFSNNNIKKKYELKVIGPFKVFEHYSKLLKLKNLLESDVINLHTNKGFHIKTGKEDYQAGKVAGDAIKIGAELVLDSQFDALVTMPINKKNLNAGGYKYDGHTYMLAEITDSKNPVMILYSNELIVVPLTIHIPVNQISDALDRNILSNQIRAVNNILKKKFRIANPKLALLSLNPHNGDNGIIGDEEKNILKPLITRLKFLQVNIKGTFAADSFFGNKIYKNFDAILSMYHDQGLIPFKMIAGKNGVNLTGGLKIIRTSPVHGTAFDIAGKGIADSQSSIEAIKLAGELAIKHTRI